MLRLNLNDIDDTVLFVNPMNDSIEIHKHRNVLSYYGISIRICNQRSITYEYEYNSEDQRDEAYEYVLNKINEYLFPQIDSSDLGHVRPVGYAEFGKL